MQIRTSEGLTHSIEVSEGVLQGEKLSPLLFNLYLSDIVSYFRTRGAVGVDLDAVTQVIMLLYADDLVILANNSVDLKRKLRILESYCEINGLTVNVSKTKVMVFRRGGPLPSLNHDFSFKGSPVEIVKSYVYLGVTFTSSAMGGAAARSNASKGRMASASALGILSRIRADSWDGMKKLYSSLVASTLLYTSSIWGLREAETKMLESAQLFFLKKLFRLPKNAPGYLLRLEFGMESIRCDILKQGLRWMAKILRMENHRLPRVSLMRLISLADSTPTAALQASLRFNWILQLKACLINLEAEDIWRNLTPEYWDLRIPEIIQLLRNQEKFDDTKCYYLSSSIQFKTERHAKDNFHYFYPARCPLEFSRLKMQVRTANLYSRRLIINGILYQYDPTQLCTLCLLHSPEDLLHILFSCPFYTPLRLHYLPNYLSNPDFLTHSAVYAFLNSNEYSDTRILYCYVRKCFQLRASELND